MLLLLVRVGKFLGKTVQKNDGHSTEPQSFERRSFQCSCLNTESETKLTIVELFYKLGRPVTHVPTPQLCSNNKASCSGRLQINSNNLRVFNVSPHAHTKMRSPS